jgi:hypothetical protein
MHVRSADESQTSIVNGQGKGGQTEETLGLRDEIAQITIRDATLRVKTTLRKII